jgi:nucleoside-diphosphate-sugar epimerase
MLVHLLPQPLHPGRVVVVGAGGFVGNAIASRLEKDVVPVLRLGHGDIDLLAPDAVDRLAALLGAGDVVVAAAARAPCKTVEMLRDNIVMACALVRAAARCSPAQVVNISSDAIYADSGEPLTERSITAPDSLHGVMHLARETMFRSEAGAPLVMLRPTLIYGAGDPHNGYGPNRFRRLANKGEPIVLFGEGEERRDHVLIDDVAEIAARVIYRRSSGVLNVATAVTASFREIAQEVVKASGRSVAINHAPRSGPLPHNGYRPFDNTACRTAFPDFSFAPLKEGLAKAQREETGSR